MKEFLQKILEDLPEGMVAQFHHVNPAGANKPVIFMTLGESQEDVQCALESIERASIAGRDRARDMLRDSLRLTLSQLPDGMNLQEDKTHTLPLLPFGYLHVVTDRMGQRWAYTGRMAKSEGKPEMPRDGVLTTDPEQLRIQWPLFVSLDKKGSTTLDTYYKPRPMSDKHPELSIYFLDTKHHNMDVSCTCFPNCGNDEGAITDTVRLDRLGCHVEGGILATNAVFQVITLTDGNTTLSVFNLNTDGEPSYVVDDPKLRTEEGHCLLGPLFDTLGMEMTAVDKMAYSSQLDGTYDQNFHRLVNDWYN
ncbi:hypothetical protein [Neptuniibacter sp. QD37_11]|uniref:hypothetical protein n=1 Tax=Neptuniibacter sp. QD37_11 TaxID=3398209 RepID=UPI0039F4D855